MGKIDTAIPRRTKPPSHSSPQIFLRGLAVGEPQQDACESPSAPICDCCPTESTTAGDAKFPPNDRKAAFLSAPPKEEKGDANDAADMDVIKELVIIGAGPHALALALRLLEPDADLSSDKERHLCADYHHRMRPLSQVRRHIKKLFQGPKSTLKQPPQKKKSQRGKPRGSGGAGGETNDTTIPGPVSLDWFRQHCTVLDGAGQDGWLASWKKNFAVLNIQQLRSPIGAHCDPYDHRALEFYAEHQKRSKELIELNQMERKNGQWDFHGPFNAPSTKLFNDFHNRLAEGYGISDVVEQGFVTDVKIFRAPTEGHHSKKGSNDPVFEISMSDEHGTVSTLKTRRVVCALGPASPSDRKFSWEDDLCDQLASSNSSAATSVNFSDLVLHANQILPWLSSIQKQQEESIPLARQLSPPPPTHNTKKKRILIVGGGITSAHLALLLAAKAADPAGQSSESCCGCCQWWCDHVLLLQRSALMERQFDVPAVWMGPARGKLQQDFRSESPANRFQRIQRTRRGGSISPEVIAMLRQRCTACDSSRSSKNGDSDEEPRLSMKEGVQIDSVELTHGSRDSSGGGGGGVSMLDVTFDDGTCGTFDMIWLATGFDNDVGNHPLLSKLDKALPIPKVNGLPVVNPDLSWGTEEQQQQQGVTSTTSTTATGDDEDEDVSTGGAAEGWKDIARRRCWILGAMAGLELGPDALNLMGARQGAVRVATAIRDDVSHTTNGGGATSPHLARQRG